jgi:hypothetical protein
VSWDGGKSRQVLSGGVEKARPSMDQGDFCFDLREKQSDEDEDKDEKLSFSTPTFGKEEVEEGDEKEVVPNKDEED